MICFIVMVYDGYKGCVCFGSFVSRLCIGVVDYDMCVGYCRGYERECSNSCEG